MPAKRKNIFANFEGLKSDYAAALPSRFRRVRQGLYGSGDAHYASELLFIRMREYVRDMDRNDAVIGQLIDRAVDNIIQHGFRLQPLTGDPALDEDLKAGWDEWAANADLCDAAGESTFADMERLVLRHQFVDGDVMALPMEDETLQMIEADRCRTPEKTKRNVVHGVLLDDRRKHMEYWFSKNQLDPYDRIYRVGDMMQVPTRDPDTGERQVFHVYRPSRLTQTRGVSALHAVFDYCGMLEDANFAELVRRQMTACIMGFLERTDQYSGDMQLGERREETLGDGSTTGTVEGIAPGLLIRGKKGEKLSAFTPNIPGQGYFDHVKFLLTIIGCNIGMPLVMVLMSADETNFSGWRGAIQQARLGFRCRQRETIARFHRPAYRTRIFHRLAAGTGEAALRSAFKRLGAKLFNHKWHTPGWAYVQPLQDAQANGFMLENLLASPTQILAEDGYDFNDVLDQTIRDNSRSVELAIKASQKISKDTGVDVHWRDVLNRALPKGSRETDKLDAEPTVGAAPGGATPKPTPDNGDGDEAE